jgi:hypothetical protein
MTRTCTLLWFASIALLPVVAAHACLSPFWLAHDYETDGGVWLPTVQLMLTALVVPGWLAYLGRLVWRRFPVNVPIGLGLLLTSLALNVFLDYALWGISSGRFRTPDGETIAIVKLIALVGFGLTVIPPSIAFAIHYCRRKKEHL